MRRVEDLQLGFGLSHAFSCEKDVADCPTCIDLLINRSSWPPVTLMDTHASPGIEFASNFHVLRVRHETEQAAETAATKERVKEMLRRAR